MPSPTVLPADFSAADGAALAALAGGWIGFHLVMDRYMIRRRGINHLMQTVRVRWMERMLSRDQRNADAILIGHAIHSVTYFASATVLMMAGVTGAFAALEATHATLSRVELITPQSIGLLQMKVLLLLGVFVYAFVQFTWSLRQCNYTLALMGAAPDAAAPADLRARWAAALGKLLSLALHRFNVGMRLYYFAIAILAWIVNPWASVVATVAVILILVRRQLLSEAFETLDRVPL